MLRALVGRTSFATNQLAAAAVVGGASASQQASVRGYASVKDTVSNVLEKVAIFLDGKVADARYIHPTMHQNSQLVGEDYNGNKYYEIKEGVLYGRHRWVVYKDVYDYSPASIPPEWHGWLHNINNDAPSRVKFLEPSYKVPATSYKYLGYQPKGSYRQRIEFGKKKKNWTKYEAWTPNN